MKIQCENCAIQHQLDPPAWVVSSGRPFRFRCSSCGHSQSVSPTTEQTADTPVEPVTTPTPAPPEDPHDAPAPPTLTTPTNVSSGDAPEPPKPEPQLKGVPKLTEAPPLPPDAALEDDDADDDANDGAVFLKQNGQIYLVKDWDTLKRWIEERRVDSHDLVSEGGVRWEPIGSRADLRPHFAGRSPPAAEPEGDEDIDAGQDLAPEVGPDRELGPAVRSDLEDHDPAPPTADPPPYEIKTPRPAPVARATPVDAPRTEPARPTHPFPFGSETPFTGTTSHAIGWHDDDTEGIPTGLPPLPTEELIDQGAFDTPSLDEPAPPALLDDTFDLPDLPDVAFAPPASAPAPPLSVPSPSGPGASDTNYESDVFAPDPPSEEVFASSDDEDDSVDDFEEFDDEDDDDDGFDDDFFPETAADTGEEDFNSDWELPRHDAKSSKERMIFGLGAAGVLVVGIGSMSMWLWSGDPEIVQPQLINTIDSEPPDPTPAPEPEPVPDPVEPTTDGTDGVVELPQPQVPQPQAEPAIDPRPAPEPVPDPVVRPNPDPVPPPPTPQPPIPEPEPEPSIEPTTMSGNINAGWEHADSNAAKALTYFNKALAVSSSNAEANLGMGYIYKEQGNAAKAKPYLCKAAKSPDASIQGDAILFLTALKLTCP